LEDGTVLGWGITEFGQETFRGGERIEFGKFPDAASIALNSRHTAVLTKQGVPLFWGGCDLWGQDHAGKPWIWSHLKKVPSAINDVQSLALDNDALFGSLNSQFDIFLKRDGTVWGAFPPIPQDAPDSECATNINPLTKTFPLIIGDAPAIQASIGNGYVFVLDKKHRLWSWWSWGKRSDAEKRLELIKLNLK
jgi:hypothetical protein